MSTIELLMADSGRSVEAVAGDGLTVRLGRDADLRLSQAARRRVPACLAPTGDEYLPQDGDLSPGDAR